MVLAWSGPAGLEAQIGKDYDTNDDLLQIMMGAEPVDKMVDDLLANYETKGLSAMLDEVNAQAAELGIKVK